MPLLAYKNIYPVRIYHAASNGAFYCCLPLSWSIYIHTPKSPRHWGFWDWFGRYALCGVGGIACTPALLFLLLSARGGCGSAAHVLLKRRGAVVHDKACRRDKVVAGSIKDIVRCVKHNLRFFSGLRKSAFQ